MSFTCKNTELLNQINPVYYELVEPNVVFVIEETDPKGKAKLNCKSGVPVFVYKDLDKHMFDVFKKRECADALIIENNEENRSTIVEFKKTINLGNWEKAQRQIEGALLQMEVITGMLGLESGQTNVVIVFLNNKMARERETSYIDSHVDLEKRRKSIKTDYSNAWSGNTISFDRYTNLPLYKVSSSIEGDYFSASFELPE